MTGDETELILQAVTAISDHVEALNAIEELVVYLPEVDWENAVPTIADDYDGQMGEWAYETISKARAALMQVVHLRTSEIRQSWPAVLRVGTACGVVSSYYKAAHTRHRTGFSFGTQASSRGSKEYVRWMMTS